MSKIKSDIYQLTESDKQNQIKVSSLYKNIKDADEYSIIYRIELGMELNLIKINNPKDFDSIITESILIRKTRNNYMKIPLNTNVDFQKAMKITGDDNEISENVKLLIIDERVKNLTKNDISNIKDCSIAKINKMKNLTKNDWDSVIKGNDKPFQKFVEKQKIDSENEANSVRNSKKPLDMDQKIFDDLIKNGIYPAINTINDYTKTNNELEKNIAELQKENLLYSNKISKLEGQLEGIRENMSVSTLKPLLKDNKKKSLA